MSEDRAPGPWMAPDEQRDAALDEIAEVLQHAFAWSRFPLEVDADTPAKRREQIDDRARLTSLLADNEEVRQRVRAAAETIEARGWLALPETRIFDVEVDDPEFTQKWSYEGIEAVSARAAAFEGARRAVRDDPHHGMPGHRGIPQGFFDEVSAENHGLIEACAMYAIVRESATPKEEYVGEDELRARAHRDNRAQVANPPTLDG